MGALKSETARYTIEQMPVQERPRERLMQEGPASLTGAELIAILLGSGTKTVSVIQLAQQLIATFGGIQQLAEASIEELCQVKGIGRAKAIQLHAAFHLSSRLSKQEMPVKYKVEHPIHVYHLVKDEIVEEQREVFLIVLLDVRGRVIGKPVISVGSLTQTLVHPREVFHPAIRQKAASLILVHNHPSGDLTPSPEDCTVTRTLIEVGKMMGIPVHDHVIVSRQGYISLRQTNASLFA